MEESYWNGSAYVRKATRYRIDDVMLGDASLISPFVLDPTNANRLYLAARSLWRSNDGGSWFASLGGPAMVKIDVIFASGTEIHLAPHGRGLFKATPPPFPTHVTGKPGSEGGSGRVELPPPLPRRGVSRLPPGGWSRFPRM